MIGNARAAREAGEYAGPAEVRQSAVLVRVEQLAKLVAEQARLLEILGDRLTPVLRVDLRADERGDGAKADRTTNGEAPLATNLAAMAAAIGENNRALQATIAALEL